MTEVMDNSGCAELLASLANEYERSRRFLAELEESLRGEVADPPVEPDEPEPSAQRSDEEDARTSPRVGLKEKLARLFTRRASPSRPLVGNLVDEVVVAPRCPSVVSLSFETGGERDGERGEFGRSASYRMSPSRARTSMELRPQRQEGLEQRRDSTSNLQLTRRSSAEQRSFTGVRAVNLEAALAGSSFKQGPNSNANSPLSSAVLSPSLSAALPSPLPDIAPQSPFNAIQRQLQAQVQQPLSRRASSSLQAVTARRSSCVPLLHLSPPEDPQLPGLEAVPRRASSFRRRSVELGASPFIHPHMHLQQPTSPGSSAGGGALSPTAPRPSASLPHVPGVLSSKAPASISGGGGASIASLRALSLTAGAAGDDVAASTNALSLYMRANMSHGSVDTAGFEALPEASSIRAGSMSRLSTAALSLPTGATAAVPSTDSPGSSSSQLMQMQVHTPMRSRSLRYASSLGGSAGRLAGVQTANGMATINVTAASLAGTLQGGPNNVRRLSFRLPRQTSSRDPAGGAEGTSFRRMSVEEDEEESCILDGEERAQRGFRGTMNVI